MSRLSAVRGTALFLALPALFSLTACGSGGDYALRVAGGNSKPLSVPGASRTSGSAPLQVELFDAGSEPAGSIVKWEWNFDDEHDGKGGWHDFTASQGSASHIYAEEGTYNAHLRVTDAAGRKATAKVQLSVVDTGNQLPVALAKPLSQATGFAPLTVSFSAEDSYDPDGGSLTFDWDCDGDGTFDLFDAGPLVAHTYDSHGRFSATLRVTDSAGAEDLASVPVWAQAWQALTVDAHGTVGQYTSLALVNGKPAISYFDLTNFDLKYAYSSSSDGSSGWTPITLDSAGLVGEYTSLALVNGRPAVSYYNASSADLKYAYSTTLDGSSGWAALTVDSAGVTGQHGSLEVINGKPAISYFGTTDLKYAYSSLADGSGGWTVLTLDSVGSVGQYSSLAVVGGKPAVSYYDASNSDLKYACSSTLDGSSGWTALTLDAAGIVGAFTSLATAGGNPAISYIDSTNLDLKYAYSSTVDGSSGWTSLTLDGAASASQGTSLALVNGRPAVSYRDTASGALKFAYSSTADGSSGWTTMVVDAAGSVGLHSSLVELPGGIPAVSYHDVTNGDLKYAWVE